MPYEAFTARHPRRAACGIARTAARLQLELRRRGRRHARARGAAWRGATASRSRRRRRSRSQGRPISASRIRDAIQDGDLARGRRHARPPRPRSTAVVVRGRRPRPDARLPHGQRGPGGRDPPAARRLPGRRHPAAASATPPSRTWASKPTFGDAEPRTLLEVHVPGVDFDFYGERIEVELVRKIRDGAGLPVAATP